MTMVAPVYRCSCQSLVDESKRWATGNMWICLYTDRHTVMQSATYTVNDGLEIWTRVPGRNTNVS